MISICLQKPSKITILFDFFSIRMVFVCLLSACGFIIVAFCQAEWQALAGIICTSISCGLGETSLLAYTPRFQRFFFSTANFHNILLRFYFDFSRNRQISSCRIFCLKGYCCHFSLQRDDLSFRYQVVVY